ncbi:MAG: fluoride efflux transporter CrcB [Deferrisomatales bacterium]|nr:fluoride efflux transporter CrcB [Deferrisomatales bacterium]
MGNLLALVLGAAIGAWGRYALAGWVSRAAETAFPWGTLVVNLAGCLAIGLTWGLGERLLWPPAFRVFLFVGVLGSFTTFSTFGLETLHLLRAAEYGRAAWYVLGSNLGGLGLVWLGMAVTRG